MWAKIIFIGILLTSFTLSYGQKVVTELDKASHLEKLKNGVLLIRLSEQKAKIKALNERGSTQEAAEIENETAELNDLIVTSFQKYYTYSKINFIYPEDTKQIVNDKSKPLKDIITGETIDLSDVENIYFTDYGYGNPADSFERYNRKGFQVVVLEDGKIKHLGRDLFYVGVKKGFFVGSFESNVIKTVRKLNSRFNSGSRYQ